MMAPDASISKTYGTNKRAKDQQRNRLVGHEAVHDGP